MAKNENGWWYVRNGKVQFNYTGVANFKNDYGWWYVKNGKVDFTYTGKAKNNYGTWNVKNGKVVQKINSGSSNSCLHHWVEITATALEEQGWWENREGQNVYVCGCGAIFSTVDEWEKHRDNFIEHCYFNHPSNYSPVKINNSAIFHGNLVKVKTGTRAYKCSNCGAIKLS